MRHRILLAAGAFALVLSAPASASPCGDAIRAVEARVDDAGTKSQALSSGGQGVAASREAQAMQADARRTEPGAPAQKLPEHDVAATAAVTPLAGGDKAMKARAALERARALDGQGNASACDEAVAEARRELGSAQ
jgi:hypothetical protein